MPVFLHSFTGEHVFDYLNILTTVLTINTDCVQGLQTTEKEKKSPTEHKLQRMSW